MPAKAVTVKQIQKLDEIAIERYGVPALSLMETAGKACADEAIKVLSRKKSKRACVVCGLGNNAGDGFVAARHLLNQGIKVDIFLIGSAKRLKNDALCNFNILKKVKVPVHQIKSVNQYFKKALSNSGVILDAIFGVGLNRTLRAPFSDIIDAINNSGNFVLAVDIPSGLDGTTGKIYGTCIKAKRTVTFTFPKKGFNKAKLRVGKIVVKDIGIPIQLRKFI